MKIIKGENVIKLPENVLFKIIVDDEFIDREKFEKQKNETNNY